MSCFGPCESQIERNAALQEEALGRDILQSGEKSIVGNLAPETPNVNSFIPGDYPKALNEGYFKVGRRLVRFDVHLYIRLVVVDDRKCAVNRFENAAAAHARFSS